MDPVTPLREFAASLGISLQVFVVIAVVLIGILLVLLWVIFAPRKKKAPEPADLPEEELID